MRTVTRTLNANCHPHPNPNPNPNPKQVRFHGLQGRADLNGTTGHVLQWEPQGGRWAVECDATEQSVRVRTSNLTALGESGEGGTAQEGGAPLLGGYAEEFVWVQMDGPPSGA